MTSVRFTLLIVQVRLASFQENVPLNGCPEDDHTEGANDGTRRR
jgi:hypothetical protein